MNFSAFKDLAAIMIHSKGELPTLKFAKREPRAGELLMSVGNPFGYDNTNTFGIISAMKRDLVMNDDIHGNLIQHDAAINPGNSGGPVTNMQGEVIAMNVAMRDNAQNIAFAIHAPKLEAFITQLAQKMGRDLGDYSHLKVKTN